MLTEERYAKILEIVNEKRSIKLTELCDILDASVSTVRRDLNALHDMRKLVKVHGGAIAIDDNFSFIEHNVEEKSILYTEEKTAISKYAASLIEDNDLVFIDAGTTTEKMADFVTARNVTFVTTGFINAKRLAAKGYKVFIPGGEIKVSTEAIVGAECILNLKAYNFTKAFVGVNGISLTGGYTTPDKNEAIVKRTVIENSCKTYIVSDHSKLDKVSGVTFADIREAGLISDGPVDKKYKEITYVKEVKI
ncbi:MAG: DeoR/GlpR family DNA-binding transcription regulator [Clostridium sp.]|nr:DeoR/GlpR family DNA-binding transcription regulator [Clostridium sp.]MCM1399402.1 DeoR/GlpR family DNA-binding transcription regulator [Clostridium sp.]MCM1459956.1 DeoR/GlpR family DNA-binding transcription regulator [Bacteroides sp.]